MQFSLDNMIALLERTPSTLDALLRGLPAAWTESNEGGESWNVCAVLAHLIHGEYEDWVPRTRHILQLGDTQPFTPFDPAGHVRYGAGKSLPQLLDEFAAARTRSLQELRALNLTAQDFARRGLHPALGSVTLSELLSTWAAHDLNHLHQICRIMAYQVRDAEGPWSQFLGIMQRKNHPQ